jgi:squalene-associated FAD-dependent desaturase
VGHRVAVVGAGWAGLAAAVECTSAGLDVTLFEASRHLGGRAASLASKGLLLDIGQHILIGAYRETLDLMQRVGASPERIFYRSPLQLAYPDGSGLVLPPGPAVQAFLRGVLGLGELSWGDRLRFLAWAAQCQWRGFQCSRQLSVANLCRDLPNPVFTQIIEPLCVAALNTSAPQASAQVFLNVLRDALLGAPGSADLLLPRQPLHAVLPEPASRWLEKAGCRIKLGQRVVELAKKTSKQALAADPWIVRGQGFEENFDRVILAVDSRDAARLAEPWAAQWASAAATFNFEPIITVWLTAPHSQRWAHPLCALRAGDEAPAQFAFDCEALGGAKDSFAFVISAASHWVEKGLDATATAVRRQAYTAFAKADGTRPFEHAETSTVRAVKRATFACTPGLLRPGIAVAPDLWAAGDYIEGPYPATLEGAVRSGLAAARAATLG